MTAMASWLSRIRFSACAGMTQADPRVRAISGQERSLPRKSLLRMARRNLSSHDFDRQ
jgi:hypothetical protein